MAGWRAAAWAAVAAGWAAAGWPAAAADVDGPVNRLIQQLGADEYAVRERAQAALERLGLEAFDALHEAQRHEDIEIALRAQRLLAALEIRWTDESDPPQVRRTLRGYSEQSAEQRRSRIDRLVDPEMGPWGGVPALCRIARFEIEDRLAKRAALHVMRLAPPEDPASRRRLAETIRVHAAASRRPSAQWLQLYARTLEDPEAALAAWREVVDREERTYAQFPEQTSREAVLDLVRWFAELLRRLGRRDEAVAAIRRSLGLLDGRREELADAVDWLAEQEAWEAVDELVARFPQEVERHALVLYCVAAARRRQGRLREAEELAAQALKLDPDSSQQHLESGLTLQERGLFDWAENEFRYVMLLGPNGSPSDLYARFLLSEILHDQQQPRRAAEVLQGAVEAIESDPNARDAVRLMFRRDPGGVASRMHYFFSLHYAQAGRRDKQIDHLERGFQADPYDADLLIAMYRLGNADQAWRRKTRTRIADAVEHFRARIAQFQQLADHPANEQQREEAQRQLASACNQLAWLVGNTEGDVDEAIRCSQQSLELLPNTAGYLDTLARCYYAKGDYETAVKHQTRAVQLDPHSGQMRRQLELFQRALAEQQAAGDPSP